MPPGASSTGRGRRSAYLARPKRSPTGHRLDLGHYRVLHDRIDPSGGDHDASQSRLHHIGSCRRHAGTDALVLVHDLDIRVLDRDGKTPARTHLDASRGYQPQPRP